GQETAQRAVAEDGHRHARLDASALHAPESARERLGEGGAGGGEAQGGSARGGGGGAARGPIVTTLRGPSRGGSAMCSPYAPLTKSRSSQRLGRTPRSKRMSRVVPGLAAMIRSPSFTPRTSRPTAVTTPANSWPKTVGTCGIITGWPRPKVWTSGPQVSAASTRATSPPGSGSGTGISSKRRSPGPWKTWARMTSGQSSPPGADPAPERDADAAVGRQGHAPVEDVEAARFDGAQQGEVGAPHDLGREEAPRVARRKRGPRALVVLAGARGLEGHEIHELRGVAALGQVLGGHSEAAQVGLGQVDAPDARVRVHVAQDVGELQGDAQVHRVLPRARIGVAEDLDAAEADREADPIAVGIERLERLVGRMVHVHLDPGDDLIEGYARDRELADRHLQPLAGRVLGLPIVDAGDLVAPAVTLGALGRAVLAPVHRVVDA